MPNISVCRHVRRGIVSYLFIKGLGLPLVSVCMHACVHVCVCVRSCACVCVPAQARVHGWSSEDNLQELILSLYYVGHMD